MIKCDASHHAGNKWRIQEFQNGGPIQAWFIFLAMRPGDYFDVISQISFVYLVRVDDKIHIGNIACWQQSIVCSQNLQKQPSKKFQTWGYTPNVQVLDPPFVITPFDITLPPLILEKIFAWTYLMLLSALKIYIYCILTLPVFGSCNVSSFLLYLFRTWTPAWFAGREQPSWLAWIPPRRCGSHRRSGNSTACECSARGRPSCGDPTTNQDTPLVVFSKKNRLRG